ncbi:MAG: ABC transporter substrate-binding protein [Chloroflexota bacterium]
MNYKTWVSLLLVAVIVASTLAAGCAPGAPAPAKPVAEVPVGSLNDMTGPTSDVGKDYALGIQEAIRWVNEQGGVNGKPIRLFQYDYGYRVPEAITTYKRFRDFDKVVAVLGWGTGDTEALAPTINADKMPYVSASYSAGLSDPKKTPYNLYAASDYSSNARAALTAWYEEIWLKSDKFKAEREAGVKPRFVAFYGWATPYASAPIKAIKDQAKLLGMEVGPDQDVTLTALDTKSQVLAAKEFKPHVVWHGNTTMSVATAVKDAAALGLGADHLVNNWGYDENLPKLAGAAAEGVIGIAVSAFYGEDVPGMDKLKASAQKYNPAAKDRLIRTVQAWANVLALWEAMKRADKAGELNGPGIMKAFESLKGYDVGLGVPPLTYTAADHRPASRVRIYQIKGGKFALLKEVDLKAKWADKWPEWLGW